MSTANLSRAITVIELGNSREMMAKWDNLTPLLVTGNTIISRVDPIKSDVLLRFRGNFYGMLRYMSVPEEHWYPHLIANKLASPAEFSLKTENIVILDRDVVDAYYVSFLTELERQKTR